MTLPKIEWLYNKLCLPHFNTYCLSVKLDQRKKDTYQRNFSLKMGNIYMTLSRNESYPILTLQMKLATILNQYIVKWNMSLFSVFYSLLCFTPLRLRSSRKETETLVYMQRVWLSVDLDIDSSICRLQYYCYHTVRKITVNDKMTEYCYLIWFAMFVMYLSVYFSFRMVNCCHGNSSSF